MKDETATQVLIYLPNNPRASSDLSLNMLEIKAFPVLFLSKALWSFNFKCEKRQMQLPTFNVYGLKCLTPSLEHWLLKISVECRTQNYINFSSVSILCDCILVQCCSGTRIFFLWFLRICCSNRKNKQICDGISFSDRQG